MWTEYTHIGVTDDNSKHPTAVFVNSYTGVGPAAGVWTAIDLTQYGVPADAKSAFLSGLLIITGGSTPQNPDLHLALRAPGSVLSSADYLGQAVAVGAGDGIRSGFASWVPLVNGQFEMQWNRVDGTTAQWPVGAAYGINLSLQAYVR